MAKSKKTPRKSATRKTTARKKPARKKKAPAKQAAKSTPANEGFVILLDDEPASDTAAPGENILDLRSDCTIVEIAGIRQRLMNSLDEALPIKVNLKGVREVDTSFLQVLCAFSLEAAARDIQITWESPSESFQQAANTLGIADQYTA